MPVRTRNPLKVRFPASNRCCLLSRHQVKCNPERFLSNAVLAQGETLYLSGRNGFKSGLIQILDTIEDEAHEGIAGKDAPPNGT